MEENGIPEEEKIHDVTAVSGMYENWFLDYASYVILERAVPALEDGMKPVQRRIMHAMKEMDDGRFNKVANVIGQTMQYHPHGDASIGDAMVNLGQKDLLIETQGNWGDINTGDSAAAPRYIEARLSKFALDVVFNPQTTEWQLSYDGRKKEPVNLPVKFPLVLAQGVEGIAVGLSTKVMPHNFIELCKGSIEILKGRQTNLYPDFPTGGMMDVGNYNEGQRGSRLRVRAKIEELDKQTLLIRELPYGTTTTTIIDSILKANDQGKIKVKKVVDNTAQNVEIEIQLPKGVSPDISIDALYKFTDCEVSISPNACVIFDDKPHFLNVNDILERSTVRTKWLLQRELEIRLGELEDKWHASSLEKIFIENRIYRDIEEEETWEGVISAIDKGLDPHKHLLRREVTEEDITKLTEIRIKRISKFDSFKADELINNLEEEMKQVQFDLEHLTDFAIKYFEGLIKKYGKGRERKTTLREFESIDATMVAMTNEKLYVNRKEGFIGYGMKKDEFICECSDIDDIIVFRRDGTMLVTRIEEKKFVGKDILHADVWRRDARMVYNVAYVDGKSGITRVKRFNVTGITRDKIYDLTKGTKGSRITYFTANPNSEAEVVEVQLTLGSKARNKKFDYHFAELDIKNRSAQGNILTKHPVRQIRLLEKGASTLGGRDIWYDEVTGRLNHDDRGKYLGSFDTEDHIMVIRKDGTYELTNHDLTNRYEPEKLLLIAQFDPEREITCLYWHGEQKHNFIKRFQIETLSIGRKFDILDPGSDLKFVTDKIDPLVKVTFRGKGRKKYEEELDLWDWEELRGWKAQGKKITSDAIEEIELLEWYEEEEETDASAEPLEESDEPIKTGHANQPEEDVQGSAFKVQRDAKPGTRNAESGTDEAREFEWDLKTDAGKAKPAKKRGKKKGGGGQMGLF
ncbi:MAG: DNA gyrase/topoisomerase IV subunit A [Bacteroidia bacterium]